MFVVSFTKRTLFYLWIKKRLGYGNGISGEFKQVLSKKDDGRQYKLDSDSSDSKCTVGPISRKTNMMSEPEKTRFLLEKDRPTLKQDVLYCDFSLFFHVRDYL